MRMSLPVWIPFSSRVIAFWLAGVLGAVAVGTAGYVILEGWSVGDGLYMTMITLSALGTGKGKINSKLA